LALRHRAQFDLHLQVPGGRREATRRGDDYDACFVGPIAVFPCEGMRDEASEQALATAFDKGGYRDVKRLRRTDDVADEDCWVKASGWSLTYH